MKAIVRHKYLQMPQIIKQMTNKPLCKAKIHRLAHQITSIQILTISIDFKVISQAKLQVSKYKVKLHTIQVAQVIPLKF